MNQFGFDLTTKEGKAAYMKAWREKNYIPKPRKQKFATLEEKNLWRRANRDPIKEAERSRKWRHGHGKEAYLECKKNYIKNNIEASRELQRRAYTRRWFKGLNAPPELIEAKHLQLMIERVSRK